MFKPRWKSQFRTLIFKAGMLFTQGRSTQRICQITIKLWEGAEKLSARTTSHNLSVILSPSLEWVIFYNIKSNLQLPCVYFLIYFRSLAESCQKPKKMEFSSLEIMTVMMFLKNPKGNLWMYDANIWWQVSKWKWKLEANFQLENLIAQNGARIERYGHLFKLLTMFMT